MLLQRGLFELLVRCLELLLVDPLEDVVRNFENVSKEVVFESSPSFMPDMYVIVFESRIVLSYLMLFQAPGSKADSIAEDLLTDSMLLLLLLLCLLLLLFLLMLLALMLLFRMLSKSIAEVVVETEELTEALSSTLLHSRSR